MPDTDPILSWVHFGDLHLTRAGEPNHRDLLALVGAANRHLAGHVSFALLPGDNAEDGTEAQFRLVYDAVAGLRMTLHILPGDHDFKPRSLDAFHRVLGAQPLPRAVVIAGCRCLFLDIVSAGSGGLDFRLDDTRLAWVQRELDHADAAGQSAAVFMHAYPADLRAGSERLLTLLARHRVLCVDMGHTHYNELANDGRTIFMATRSTGQIEEGPVGFSVAAIDRGVVSWRFAPLEGAWPLVLITHPADHRLVTGPHQGVRDTLAIRAKVWGQTPPAHVSARIDGAGSIPLAPDPGDQTLWQADIAADLPDGLHTLTVETSSGGGETITFIAGRHGCIRPRHADGSDRDAIGPWPEKGIFGTQLGPNRNGRAW